MNDALNHYQPLISYALSDLTSSCPPICSAADECQIFPDELARIRELEMCPSNRQECVGECSTSPSPTISPEDLDLLDYPAMQFPPATPFLCGTPLPNFDVAMLDLPLAEICLPAWDLPNTCPFLPQHPHVQASQHNGHDESGLNDAQDHIVGCWTGTESSVPTYQSWSNGGRSSTEEEPTPSPAESPEPTPSPAESPSPKACDQLRGKRTSSQKTPRAVRTASMKQQSKPKSHALRRKTLVNDRKPSALSDWSSDGMEEANASTDEPMYKSKNLVTERRRRVKLNEKLFSLRAMVPRISKMDKASIVADAIDYVKDLHRKLESAQNDILALQAGTYVSPQEGVSSHASEVNDVQQHKQAHILQYKIVQLHVSNVELKVYHLRIHCKSEPGVLLQLTKALESLKFKILSASLTTVANFVINTIIIKADEVLKAEDFKELLKKSFPTFGLHL